MAIAEQPGKDIATAVLDHLRTGSRLLILDNCEHVLEATAAAVHRVLATCPDVRVLATSREGLGIPGEALYPVPSLSLPEVHAGRRGGRPVRGRRPCSSSGPRPFAQGSGSAATTPPRVAQLVRRLDGIPLALELAAARTRVLTVDQIAARLDDQFRLLAGGSRVAVPRHQTLQATMDWSYDLLTDDERAVFRRLAVFAGSLSLEAAESICGTDPVDPIDVLDLLTRLVDKSLVVAEPTARAATACSRPSASTPVTSSSRPARRRSSGAAIATGTRPSSSGPRPSSSTAPSPGPGSTGSASSTTTSGRPSSGAQARRRNRSPGSASRRASGGSGRSAATRTRGGPGSSGCSRRSGPTGRSLLVADALVGAGVLASMQGDDDAAISFGERSLAIQRRLGDPTAIAYAINNLANAAVRKGDFARARSLYTECVTLARSTGDERGQGFALINLAGVAAQLGDDAGARTGFEESIAIFERFGDRWGIAFAQDEFATVLARQGDASTAGSLHEMALETWRELGDQRGVARALVHLADVAEIEGNLAEARNRSRQSLAIRQGLGDMPGIAAGMEKLAWVLAPGAAGGGRPAHRLCRGAPRGHPRPDPGGRPGRLCASAGVRSGTGWASRRWRTRSARGARWPPSRSWRRCRPELGARVWPSPVRARSPRGPRRSSPG